MNFLEPFLQLPVQAVTVEAFQAALSIRQRFELSYCKDAPEMESPGPSRVRNNTDGALIPAIDSHNSFDRPVHIKRMTY